MAKTARSTVMHELDSCGLDPWEIDDFIDDVMQELGYEPEEIIAWFSEHVAQRAIRQGYVQGIDGQWSLNLFARDKARKVYPRCEDDRA